jgi:polyisoprenoid-binding protein YceI
MTLLRSAALVALCGGLVLTSGCGASKPPEGTKSAVVYEDTKPAETPAPAAAAPEAPATPAPAPAPEAAPAPAKADDWDELDAGSISGKQDLGMDVPNTAAPAAAPEAAPAPAAAEAAPAASAAAPVAGGKVYIIEPNDDSFIDFTGYKVSGHKDGGFSAFGGKVTVPDGDPVKAQIELTVDLASVFSEAGALTDTLKGPDFFDVAKYAQAKFTSTGIEKTADGYLVKGDFDLHGIVKPIGFPATISIEGDTLKAKSEFTIDRNTWNVSYAGLTDDLIKPEVLVKFDIVANVE